MVVRSSAASAFCVTKAGFELKDGGSDSRSLAALLLAFLSWDTFRL